MPSHRSKVFKTLLCMSVLWVPYAKAQWSSDGPPHVLQSEIKTVGGITYFRMVAQLSGGSCCDRIAGYAVSRQGSSLSQILQQESFFGFCEFTFCDPWQEEWVSVLGALPPGSYTLSLSAADGGLPFYSPWGIIPFTVPADTEPTLRVSTHPTSSSDFLINVAGISNVVYVLQFSSDLTNWTALKTNVGFPVTFSQSITNGPQRFYRAAILQAPSRRL